MTKKKLLAPLFIAASFLLVGCSADTIVGRPGWINQNIINGDFKDNKMKDIYDAIKALGDTNSNVLNKVMYQIAQNQLGTFEEIKALSKDTASDEDIKAFVEKHSAYKSENKGYKKGAEDLQDLTDAEKIAISRAKIKAQYEAIINRVCELMYNEVKDGSYTTDGVMKLFSEEEYVRHLKKELYHPEVPQGFTYDGKQVFTPKPTDMEWFEFVNCPNSTADRGYLHIMEKVENVWQFTGIYYPKTDDGEDHGYIGRKILPDVYRELLIENYVREQRYTNLGRAYARKVKMIKIAHSEGIDGKFSSMLTYYAKQHITGWYDNAGTFHKPTKGSLDELNEAMRGIADIKTDEAQWGTARKYLEAGEFEKIVIPGTTTPIQWKMRVDTLSGEEPATRETTYVYRGTKLGDIVEKFLKAFNLSTVADINWGNFTPTPKFPLNDEAKSAYNEFTNNDAYPVEVGVELKERELFSTDLTQDGWFMKSGGLTDISDEFRNQLFNINTSLIVDDEDKMKFDEHGWGEYKTGDSARYFETTATTDNKHAYIVDNSVSESTPWESVVLIDKDRNFFIIEVDEAASLAKLSTEDERSYLRLKANDDVTTSNIEMDKAVRDIVKPVASGDTYKKNAEQYYLMISNILFYDQSVYDYFKSQFPELFK